MLMENGQHRTTGKSNGQSDRGDNPMTMTYAGEDDDDGDESNEEITTAAASAAGEQLQIGPDNGHNDNDDEDDEEDDDEDDDDDDDDEDCPGYGQRLVGSETDSETAGGGCGGNSRRKQHKPIRYTLHNSTYYPTVQQLH